MAGVVGLDPRSAVGFPVARPRKYMIFLRHGIQLCTPLQHVVSRLSKHQSNNADDLPAWSDLLLKDINVTHHCTDSLHKRSLVALGDV